MPSTFPSFSDPLNPQLPEVLRQHNLAFGAEGRRWLDDLPHILQACADRWQLQIEPAVEELSFNYVAPATRADGQKVILKLGALPSELKYEVLALHHYDGRGSVRLIDADIEAGIFLLERLLPGHMLVDLEPAGDEAATRIAVQVMKHLWRPLPADHPFPTVAQWARGFKRLRERYDGGTGPFPAQLVEQAEAIYERLLATTEQEVLLHGDLHHYNILSAEREAWLAIDPKGVAGEPAYEAGALLRNPIGIMTWPDLENILSRRLDILANELQMDRQRIQDWAVAQIVLSAWWSHEAEDDDDYDAEWEAFAERLKAA